jgi:predicted dithiol-disulfide oxidoreductase (DUF899 family)
VTAPSSSNRYHVSFTADDLADGTDDGTMFHTDSTYARGVHMVNGACHLIDLTPKGRDEAGHDNPQFWARRHDEYGT